MTHYLEEDRQCDPSTADTHEEEAANDERPSAHTLDSEALQTDTEEKPVVIGWIFTYVSIKHKVSMISRLANLAHYIALKLNNVKSK